VRVSVALLKHFWIAIEGPVRSIDTGEHRLQGVIFGLPHRVEFVIVTTRTVRGGAHQHRHGLRLVLPAKIGILAKR
jgi:hypothetical protein